MSLSRIVAKTINPQEEKSQEGKTIVVVGTVTDDTRYVYDLQWRAYLDGRY